ncbi:MAG: oligosaccharide flippase family protein [Oscillospiraceae bacterium]|nr:oligosaccharide flippase family protein [Oscillospiraceae bacterium]
MEKIRRLFRGAAGDSLLLGIVKVVTAVFGLFTAKLLSTCFSLQEYGTYSQAMLVVSFVSALSALGLHSAANYFYNASADEHEKNAAVATIVGIECFVGSLAGLVVCLFGGFIVRCFKNADLLPFLYIAAWMPVLENLSSVLQVLVVSIGKAKSLAVRNFAFSLCRLLFVLIASFVTRSIRTVFVLLLVFDVCQLVFFYAVFSHGRSPVSFTQARKELILPILRFGVMMAAVTFTNRLLRDADKFVVSFFADTETLAIYTNAARLLPFDLVTNAFMTVLIPIVTRMIRGERRAEALACLRAYIRIGYLLTGIMVTGAIVCAREMMLLLYDAKYLPGLPVFIVYLLVDLVQYANLSLVLTAKGKSGMLLLISCGALSVNLVFDVVTYPLFGPLGPALTTLCVIVAKMLVYMLLSAGEIGAPLSSFFDGREVAVVAAQLVCFGLAARLLKRALLSVFSSYHFPLFLTYGLFFALLLLLNRRRIASCLTELNAFR